MTRELLKEAGEALYGHLWQSELARALGYSDRHMRRLVSGEWPVPHGLQARLLKLCRGKGSQLRDLARRLKEVS